MVDRSEMSSIGNGAIRCEPAAVICTPHPFMIGQVIVTGPEIDSAPAVVVESSGRKADGPMTMPGHEAR